MASEYATGADVELRVTVYGTELLQAIETAEAAFDGAVSVLNTEAEAEATQEACTVAETLIEAVAVAAATNLIAGPKARMTRARADDEVFIVTALPPARTSSS
jgi:hypothetical protein